ncbi:MAG: heterodisulfide reductase-related iron-sulfur binding cluster [Pseudomonadales bacterium]|jgi:Fe-S oxidoreductase|nr:heterodisulfide reductase-related iron-sulfur binding cluster [Pseudomonadales bacterium]
MADYREGNLEKPRRAPHAWQTPEFWNEDALNEEMERVFDICHTCRRCVSLCQSFPVLFDLVDESETMEVDGVAKEDYGKVVDQCYLCDLCAETKCPYLPPHEFNLDFPHLMLRAKAVKFARGDSKWRDRLITSTDGVFKAVGQPGMAQLANAANSSKTLRNALDRTLGIHPDAPLPTFHSRSFKRSRSGVAGADLGAIPTDRTTGRVALYTTCYGNWNEPQLGEDLVRVFNHNGLPVKVLDGERCCGMPKFELGDLKAVQRLKEHNIPVLLAAIEDGWDIIAPVPSCVLMFKQELPLMFPDDADVKKVAAHVFDPFEYLMLRHKGGKLRTDFETPLGKVAYHAACHQRVQNIGQKTRELLALVPGTEVTLIERCSGHDGTYAYRSETHDHAVKIARPVVNRVKQVGAEHFGSDCPMAGRMIQHGLAADDAHAEAEHPITMLRVAYGL